MALRDGMSEMTENYDLGIRDKRVRDDYNLSLPRCPPLGTLTDKSK